MGSIASVLGHAASGFEQARQTDLQRQFEMEQSSRQQLVHYLSQVAGDENAHPEARNAAAQGLIQVSTTPLHKKVDPGKILGGLIVPGKGPQTQSLPGITQGPPAPPPGMNVSTPPAQQPQGGGYGPLPALADSSSAPTLSASAPPPPPPGLLDIAPGSATLAAQPGGIYMSLPERAEHARAMAAAQAGGSLGGQIEARGKALAQIPELPPEIRAGLTAGVPMYGAMTRSLGKGILTAGEARAQGITVDKAIPDDQMVNINRTMSGTVATPTDATPAGKVSTADGAISRQEADIAKEQRGQALWAKRNAVSFGQRIALQQTSLQTALQKSDYVTAQKIVKAANTDVDQAIMRQRTMDTNYADALKTGSQQAMLSLVANHIGMTLGAQKGARITRAVWDEAMQSAPWMDVKLAKAFHKDANGDMIFDGWKSGVTLTAEQMKQMVDLAHQRVGVLHDNVKHVQDEYQSDLAVKSGAQPPKPPDTAKPNLTDPLGIR